VTLRVGLVGAGPWAGILHAPMLSAGPETELAGVWARRHDAASELATRHHVHTFGAYQELLDACDAVAFAVPPDVQASMAVEAAAAGKHLLLEKPIGLTVDEATRLADAVGEAGVASMVVFTWRFSAAVRSFIDSAHGVAPVGGRGWFLSGALLGGWFATPWRLEHGALLDLGPHVIDLLDVTLGPVVGVQAHGDSLRTVGLLLDHEGGASSEASLSATVHPDARHSGCEVYSATGSASLDLGSVSGEVVPVLRAEFAAACADPKPHPLDVHRGLHIQRVIEAAREQL
jgi:predicted dehydrogenase